MAYYAPTNAYLVLIDSAPKAKEVAEDVTAFLQAYREDLHQASGEEELPRAMRDALAELKKGQQRREKGCIRFADFNGIYLPGCPGQCPPGTLADAWSRLAAQERLAFAPLLGLLARVWGPTQASFPAPRGSFSLAQRPPGPRSLATTPFDLWKDASSGSPPDRFPAPLPALTPPWRGTSSGGTTGSHPPDGQLKDVIKAVRRTLR